MHSSSQPRGLAAGFLAGSALMYFLDPQHGRRRRAVAAGKLEHLSHVADAGTRRAGRDLLHRTRGVWLGLASRLRRDDAGDEVIAARVRTRLGHVCSHPGSLTVTCEAGRIGLRGRILGSEVAKVLKAVNAVRGVREVIHDLEIHERGEGIPDLQGGIPRRGERFELLQRYWSPGTRFLMSGVGLGLAGSGLAGGRLLVLAAGALITARSLTNMEMKRLIGIGAGRRAVDVKKSLHVHAPIAEVYAFFRALENFPRFMRHVEEVREVGPGRYHWRVTGPAKTTLSWDAELTRDEPARLLAWKSVPGAIVGQAGWVRFFPEREDVTRLEIQLSYNPPAGALGHAFARLLGMDPKKQMDEDLLRFKSLLENGKATGRQGTVVKDEMGNLH